MMTEYQELVLVKMVLPLVLLAIIFFVYFIFNKNQSIGHRLLASLHSLIAIMGVVYAIVAGKFTSQSSFSPHTQNFSKILAIAVIFAFICVFYFKGNKKVHLLLLVFLFCLAYVWHVGGMAITHTL